MRGEPARNGRELVAVSVRPLNPNSSYYRVHLEVRSTDPLRSPLKGAAKFFLHPTFQPDEEVVDVEKGVATLILVAYGAFTVGVELDQDGTRLELDLSSKDVDAPQAFKGS